MPAVVVVALVALLAVVAAGLGGGWSLQPRRWFDDLSLSGTQRPMPDLAPAVPPPPMTPASPLQQWIANIVLGVVVLAFLVGLFFLGRWLWRRRPRRVVVAEDRPDATPAGVVAEADLPTLLRGAQAAEGILQETGGVPRDLVQRCWLALEEAAAASGAARRPSDSPTEFTGAVLRSTAVDPDAVDTLLRLYHLARFSTHQLSDSDVRAARTAVVRLAQTWRGFDTAMRHTARTES